MVPAILCNSLFSMLLGCTATLDHPAHFKEKQLIPTLAFRLLLVDEIELVCWSAPNHVCWITWDVTYTMGLELLIDECTGEASTIWIMSTDHVDAYETLPT
jgi:hypothetical protein